MADHFTEEDRKELTKNALFLFANRAPRDMFNRLRLQQTHSHTNPIAKIKAETTKKGLIVANNSHYDDTTPPCTLLCRNAKVCLTGCNIQPAWGLYNGTIGTVLDIVYEPNTRPPSLPSYVLVDFPDYRGPPFLLHLPTAAPIPPVTVQCNKHMCCTRKFMPLILAYGKTVHTFQGQNAGPVDPGKHPNAVQRIICDPGTRQFEGTNIGLFYTILSRATTLGPVGDDKPSEKKFKGSAIYFIGKNMNRARITKITKQANGTPYIKVQKRTKWVSFLRKRIKHKKLAKKLTTFLYKWSISTHITRDKLKTIILFHSTNPLHNTNTNFQHKKHSQPYI